jgi:predicted nucleotidyltransferase
MDGPASTKREVLDRLTANRRPILDMGVRSLGIFGSFAAGRPSAESDVDVLVEFDPSKKSFDAYWGLSEFLEETLHRPVDLLTRESLSPYFGPRILAEVEYVALGK